MGALSDAFSVSGEGYGWRDYSRGTAVRVARMCLDFGQRVQAGVLACELDPDTFGGLRLRLLDTYDAVADSLRFDFLGSAKWRRVEHHGTIPSTDLSGPMIV